MNTLTILGRGGSERQIADFCEALKRHLLECHARGVKIELRTQTDTRPVAGGLFCTGTRFAALTGEGAQ